MTNLHDHPKLIVPPHPGSHISSNAVLISTTGAYEQGTKPSYQQRLSAVTFYTILTSSASWPYGFQE